MKQIDLEPHRHTTRIEVRTGPKWLFALMFLFWFGYGWLAFGFSSAFPWFFAVISAGLMLAAVGTWPRFFFSDDKNQR